MRVLVLDSALARCTAAVVTDDEVTVTRTEARKQGHESVLPAMARDVMGVAGERPDLIGVTIGPGSFTGIRAAIALAHGIALGLGVPVIGVTVGEAITDAFPHLGARTLWIVTPARRGHVFLETCRSVHSHALENLPLPAATETARLAIAGAAANEVAARLAARGLDILLTDARFALPRHVALVARRRHQGLIAPRVPQPLYVDPPDAKPPAAGPRPPPSGTDG